MIKRKNQRLKSSRKLGRKKKIRRRAGKKIPKINFKKIKGIKISKQLKQLKEMKILNLM